MIFPVSRRPILGVVNNSIFTALQNLWIPTLDGPGHYKKGLQATWLGTASHLSTISLPNITTCDQISQVFPSTFVRIYCKRLKCWRWEWLGNQANLHWYFKMSRLHRTYLLLLFWGKLWLHSQAFYTSSSWSLAVSKNRGRRPGEYCNVILDPTVIWLVGNTGHLSGTSTRKRSLVLDAHWPVMLWQGIRLPLNTQAYQALGKLM